MPLDAPEQTSKPREWPTRKYTSPHATFPFTTNDLSPVDMRPDAEFYYQPRFVTHIDDHAIAVLRQYYGSVLLEASGSEASNTIQKGSRNILDLCSSWISHFPQSLEEASASGAVSIAGIGMNGAELAKNPLFQNSPAESSSDQPGQDVGRRRGLRFLVRDLNADPTIPPFDRIVQENPAGNSESLQANRDESGPMADKSLIDATTLTVSIDYMTSPIALLSSLLTRTKLGGTLHVVVSNRCFPTKAVRRWLRMSEEERLDMVAEILVWSGWSHIEILCLCDGTVSDMETVAGRHGVLDRLFEEIGLQGGARVDPLWVVRGRKGDGESVIPAAK